MNTNYKVYVLVDRLSTRAKESEASNPMLEVSQGKRGAVVGHMNKYLGGTPLRRALLGLLFAADNKPMSSKKLKPSEVSALAEWIGAVEVDPGDWSVTCQFIDDCSIVREFYGVANILVAGVSIFDSFCSRHGENGEVTPHLFVGNGLKCLKCFPDLDYRKKAVE